VVTPGEYDAPGALLIAEAGFETAYLSGASLTRSGSTTLNDLLGTKAFLKIGKNHEQEEK